MSKTEKLFSKYRDKRKSRIIKNVFLKTTADLLHFGCTILYNIIKKSKVIYFPKKEYENVCDSRAFKAFSPALH